MDFILTRGKDFVEHFDFKNEKGRSVPLPRGLIRLVLERGTFAREYRVNEGLTRGRSQIVWRIDGKDSANFEFSTLYYTLYLNDAELVRGVLKVQ